MSIKMGKNLSGRRSAFPSRIYNKTKVPGTINQNRGDTQGHSEMPLSII